MGRRTTHRRRALRARHRWPTEARRRRGSVAQGPAPSVGRQPVHLAETLKMQVPAEEELRGPTPVSLRFLAEEAVLQLRHEGYSLTTSVMDLPEHEVWAIAERADAAALLRRPDDINQLVDYLDWFLGNLFLSGAEREIALAARPRRIARAGGARSPGRTHGVGEAGAAHAAGAAAHRETEGQLPRDLRQGRRDAGRQAGELADAARAPRRRRPLGQRELAALVTAGRIAMAGSRPPRAAAHHTEFFRPDRDRALSRGRRV